MYLLFPSSQTSRASAQLKSFYFPSPAVCVPERPVLVSAPFRALSTTPAGGILAAASVRLRAQGTVLPPSECVAAFSPMCCVHSPAEGEADAR